INTYGDLDGIFANVDKNTPKLRENLEAHEDRVRQNAKATPLVRDVPLDVTLDDVRQGQWDPDEVRKLFTFLEFRVLWDRLVEAVGLPVAEPEPGEPFEIEVERVRTAADAAALLDRLHGEGAATVA